MPFKRLSHAACCLGYGKDDNKLGLFVHGGINEEKCTLADAWIFYVTHKIWKKVHIQLIKPSAHALGMYSGFSLGVSI